MRRSLRGVWGAWPIVLWVLLVAVLCGIGVWYPSREGDCRTREAAVAAQLHAEIGPVARELAPLGRVLEVHWVQQVSGGMCDLSPGSLRYERQGVARLDPADVVRLNSELFTDNGGPDANAEPYEPDPRLRRWLPTNPHWRRSPALDARFDPRNDFGSAWYAVDTVSGLAYFSSDVDYEPEESHASG